MFSSPITGTSSMLLLSSRTSAPSAEHNTNSNTSHNLSDTTQVTIVNDVNNSPNNNYNTPERRRMILTDRLKSCVLNLQSELLMKVKQEDELSSQLADDNADDDRSDDSSHLLNGDNNNNINNHSNSNNNNNDNNDYSNKDVDGDSNRSLPYYVNMMEQILDRCQHFLIFPSVHMRLTTLHIVSVLCPALKSYQDVLLPLVHKIWKPFVNRFKDEEHFIAIKAFEVLKEISEASGDFVRRRMVSEVMPKVIEALTSLAKSSVKQPSSYQYTTACKLQSCILLNLGPMSRYADIQGQALMNIVHPCMPYLSAKQPTILQQVCMDTVLEFVKIDSSIVWLALCQAYPPTSKLVPPNITSSSSSLHNFQLCPPPNLPSYQVPYKLWNTHHLFGDCMSY
ncbi:hypothetical protein HELRODRAFT_174193 [Helobdella robusta]|uniref:TTI1 C-terminal TPR domain-containing protein n=1 Tax=Helobdella robusta TaxID=6412 RepID=T1F7R5_HELRO|nr:hypothetical protein HELRODRAFT_174193 [Helobdella robusta]ESO02777.1 hypothetical protein HELRODRAFT_174193 [Helobdella robusta]